MSENALTAFHTGGGVPTVEEMNAALAQGRMQKPQAGAGGKTLLRLDPNEGVWVYGPDNVEVEEESRWAIHPGSFSSGWVCWADPKLNGRKNEKLGEVMGPMTNPPACPTTDHSERGGEWKEQIGFLLVCIGGEDEGEEVLYQNSSLGALKAYEAIYEETVGRPSPDHFFPIVELEVGSYKNKTYNKTIYEPQFTVVDWADAEQNMLGDGVAEKIEAPEADDVEVEAAPEADAGEEKPKRQRRRRKAKK